MRVDTPIRQKTPYEVADELRREQAADSRHAAIKAMANALGELGYTRDHDVRHIKPSDARHAVGAGLKALIAASDWQFLVEFIVESGNENNDRAMFNALADFMLKPSTESAERFVGSASTRSRWYGDSYLEQALDTLDSASEIQRDREVDMAIDERKSA